MTDLSNVYKLAGEYKRKAECSGKWTDYVKAHGLANYCVVKDSTEDRKKLVYNIEESWYKGRHPLSYNEHQQLIQKHKSLLKSYRDVTSSDYEWLEVQVNKIDRDDILSQRNLSLAESFKNQVFVMSEKCSNGLKELSASVMQTSVEILQQIGSQAPCKFAVIGLGSLAKGEATPYSDLEYAFIVEHSDEYFENLAVDSYFRIGNLGETPSRYFDIAELASEIGEDHTTMIIEEIPAGYRIDGLMKKAGNIPTGNGTDDGKVLTLTVDGFIELYKSEANSPFDKSKPGDLSDLLSSSVVIYTNEGDESLLHEEFDRKRRETFELLKSIDTYRKRYQTLITDIKSGSFSSRFIKFQPPKNFGIKLKRDIFRYPTLLANNIKMLLGLNTRYSWEVFTHLHTQGMLCDKNYRSIGTVLALAIYIRTREYINNKAQIDHFSVIPTAERFSDTSVQGAVFVFFGCLLDSLKQSVHKNVESEPAGELLPTQMVRSILKNVSFQKDSLQVADVCYFAGQYDMTKHELGKGFGFPFEKKPFYYVLHTLHQMSNSKKDAEKYLELCCYILYHTKHYDAADSYFQWLIQNEKKKETPNSDVKLWLLLRAHCKKEQFLYLETRELVNEAIRDKDRPPERDANHPDECDNYINIAIMLESLSEYQAAKGYLEQAQNITQVVYDEKETAADKCYRKESRKKNKATAQRSRIYNLFGVIYNRLGNYSESLKWCKESLSMNKRIFGEDAQIPEIAHSYNTIGHTYGFLGKYDSSLEYHQKSLAMRKAIYGETTDHPETAHSYNNIGHEYGCKAKYDLSLENLEKGLEMRKKVHGAGTNHPHIAKSYHNIGNTYGWKGSYKLALEYHTKALDMRLAIYGATTINKHIADSYDYAGRQHHILGNFTKALEFQSKSLDMRKRIHSKEPNHRDIATNYDYMGKARRNLGEYSQSLEDHKKALEMRKNAYDANSNHPHLATSYNNVGTTYLYQGDYSRALENHTIALKMRKAVHGPTTYHPDITITYDYVERAHTGLEDYSAALECLNKSLKMRQNEPRGTVSNHYFGHSYDNLGAVHYGLQDYTLSLSLYYWSLEKRRLFYGNNGKHPDIASSYRGIANAYSKLNDHELALEYHIKAHDMLEEIYCDATNHPHLVQSSQDVAEARERLATD